MQPDDSGEWVRFADAEAALQVLRAGVLAAHREVEELRAHVRDLAEALASAPLAGL
jgi:hypothetical protein